MFPLTVMMIRKAMDLQIMKDNEPVADIRLESSVWWAFTRLRLAQYTVMTQTEDQGPFSVSCSE